MLFQERTLLEHIAFIHAKLALILWGVLYAVWPPVQLVNEIGYTLVYISAGFSIFGSIAGIVGLIMSDSKVLKRRYQGLIIESAGLLVALCGPLTFFVTIAYLILEFDDPQGHSFAAISYALCASFLSRIVVVRKGMKKGV